MSDVDPAAVAAARFNERVNQRLAGLKAEGLVIYATAPYGSGPDHAHGIYVIVNDHSPASQLRIQTCLKSLGRPIEIVKRVATLPPESDEDTGE